MENKEEHAKKMSGELQLKNPDYVLAIHFKYGNIRLGYSFAYVEGFQVASMLENPFGIHNIDW